MYLEKEQELNTYIKTLDGVRESLDKLMDEAKEHSKAEDKSIKKAIGDVNDFRKEMKKEVDNQCDALIETLQKPNVNKINFIAEIEKQKQNIDLLVRECKEKIVAGKFDMIEYNPPSPSSFIPHYARPLQQIPIFEPEKKTIEIIRKGVGEIKYMQREKEENMVSRNLVCEFDKSMLHIEKINGFKSNIGVTAISVVGNGRAWVAHFESDTMYLYDTAGTITRSLVVMEKVGINDMVVGQSGEIIVTNMDKKVRRVSVDGEMTTLIDTSPVNVEGVCVVGTGQICVCLRGKGEQSHLAMYSLEGGAIVREIRGKDKTGKQWITDPFSVVQNGQYYCIVNYVTNVVAVDHNGSFAWVYDGTQAKLKQRFDPMVVCSDKYLNLLVSDSGDHCVHYLDREGQLIQIIFTRDEIGMRGQWAIGVDDEACQVWFGRPSGDIIIAKYLK